eukprot:CAMPEP_0115489798 /NCGR_PEP_ID=MMETSP0271-20121206/62213_1 /TAXON_ID=71861 /ORGANISM="Scrippsiella trochoidea, Strain CCMP3099" /LENGTH=100 /DNA_ID=CAMNT_0002918003 /DNA_START=641 /DNA_END=943 /DNA_ORIENTATION=+
MLRNEMGPWAPEGSPKDDEVLNSMAPSLGACCVICNDASKRTTASQKLDSNWFSNASLRLELRASILADASCHAESSANQANPTIITHTTAVRCGKEVSE